MPVEVKIMKYTTSGPDGIFSLELQIINPIYGAALQ